MAVCQPTNFLLAALNSNVGASLLAKAACLAKASPSLPTLADSNAKSTAILLRYGPFTGACGGLGYKE
jgi:hypothetical protein